MDGLPQTQPGLLGRQSPNSHSHHAWFRRYASSPWPISRTLPPFKGEKTEPRCSVGVVPGGGSWEQALVGQAGLVAASGAIVRHVADDRRPLGRPATLGLPCTCKRVRPCFRLHVPITPISLPV